MTQNNPSPYGQHVPMNLYGADPLTPSRRSCHIAAIVLFVVGGLICLLGFCLLGSGLIVSSNLIPPEDMAQLDEMQSQIGMPFGLILAISGGCACLPGVLYVVLGFFVYRASRIAIIFSLIVTGLIAMLTLLNAGGSIMNARSESSASLLGMFCVQVVILGILAALFMLLLRAFRAAVRPVEPQTAYTAQWQQYYQQYYSQQTPLTSGPSSPPPSLQTPSDPPPPPVV